MNKVITKGKHNNNKTFFQGSFMENVIRFITLGYRIKATNQAYDIKMLLDVIRCCVELLAMLLYCHLSKLRKLFYIII